MIRRLELGSPRTAAAAPTLAMSESTCRHSTNESNKQTNDGSARDEKTDIRQ